MAKQYDEIGLRLDAIAIKRYPKMCCGHSSKTLAQRESLKLLYQQMLSGLSYEDKIKQLQAWEDNESTGTKDIQ